MPSNVDREKNSPEVQLILVDSNHHTFNGDILSALKSTPPLITHCHSLVEANQALDDQCQNVLLLPVEQSIPNTLIRLQTQDPLTGAGNRQHFYHQLQQVLRQIHSTEALSLMMLDIDNFTSFNHQYGHDIGDRLVALVAERLDSCQGKFDLCRIGNDEFTMVVRAPLNHIKIKTRDVIEQIIELLLPAYEVNEHTIHLHCSIGVAIAPEHSTEFDDLIRYANTARIRAKKLRGHSYAIFDAQKDLDEKQSINLEPELWQALQKRQFCLYYQPRICLSTHRIIGAEALIRWEHPVHGMIPPDEFIPISEKSGLIVPIGYWVVEQVGQDMQLLKEAGLPEQIGVNLSFRQFQDGYLASTIERLIIQHHIDTRQLEFELTETALFRDEPHVVYCMESLSQLGAEFSLDDFGTGYSSFAMLQKLPISTLKIDKSFVAGIGKSEGDEEIVRSIISLARNLKKKVIAEGVETAEQLAFLKEHHCPMAQGFYFSRPVPLESFIELLNDPSSMPSL